MDENETNTPAGGAPPPPQQVGRALLVILAIAAIVRIALALNKSLVLDEFHSWYHATQPNFGAFLDGLARDNHPPLSFLVIGAARAALGSAEIALRSPAILYGLVELAIVARLARRVSGPRAAVLAALFLATSAMHMDYGTQARMYALHALTVTVFVAALIEIIGRQRPGRGAGVALALAAAASFHTHYFGVQYLGPLTLAGAVVAVRTGHGERALRLVVPLALSVLISLPWALTGFRDQLAHELPPGGDDVGVMALAESFVHLFAHNLSFGGESGRFVFAGAGGVALLLAAAGGWSLVRRSETRVAGVLFVTCAFAVPLITWCVAQVAPRAGYTWHYVLPSAASAAVLAGVAARGRLGTIAACTALPLMATLCGLHLARPATEDFRGAIEYALQEYAAAPAELERRMVSVEFQPALFPQGQPYDYYAPRLMASPPEREPMIVGDFGVLDPVALKTADRVIVIRRSLPEELFLLRTLRETFGPPRVRDFGYGVDVLIYERE